MCLSSMRTGMIYSHDCIADLFFLIDKISGLCIRQKVTTTKCRDHFLIVTAPVMINLVLSVRTCLSANLIVSSGELHLE
jgi:hypothetical protein